MSRLGNSWFGSLFGKWGHGEEIERMQSRLAVLEGEMTKAAELRAKLVALDKSQAVIEFSLDGRILDANENFLRTVGYSLDEIRGQHHSLFVDPAYRDSLEYRQFWMKLGRGDFDAGQYRRLGRGGREIWLEATYNPVFDAEGRPVKVVKFATDITAQIHTNQALQRAVAETQGVVAAAQSGDLRPRIPLEGKSGPIGELCEGVNRMLDDIVIAQERERAVAGENARIRIALDNVGAAVVIADNDLDIIYVNDAATDLFRAAEIDIRRDIPEFDARALIGTRLDLFSRTADRNAALLKNLRGAHHAEVAVGGRTLALVASPVLNASGERLGTVVQWRDRTEEVRTENQVAAVVRAAANGDLGQRVSVEGLQGFVRVLGEGINQLLDTSQSGLQEIVRVLSALSRGDLNERITNDYAGTFGELKDNTNETVTRLTDIVGQIKQAASAISTATHEIAAGNADLSRRTEEQAASLEQTASNMDELTGTVKQNADNAKQANQLAIGASDVAVRGGAVVAEVVDTMKSISESAKRIAEIISVIDGIAFQTNILALNAAVEAARAGEQGRGFAVVASEVRNLAQRSAAAAKEIKTLIADSTDKVQTGSQLVTQAGETMNDIVSAVSRVTTIMSEIAAASTEQSSGIESVNEAIAQMDDVTQQNAALVEEAAAAAESMLEQADMLMRAVGSFKLGADTEAPVPAAKKLAVRAAHLTPRTEPRRPRSQSTTKADETDWQAF